MPKLVTYIATVVWTGRGSSEIRLKNSENRLNAEQSLESTMGLGI